MKRIFLFLFAALSMIVLTTACSKSDDGFNPDDQKKMKLSLMAIARYWFHSSRMV